MLGRRGALFVLVILLPVVGLAACGNDDNKKATSSGTKAAGKGAASSQVKSYCAASLKLETVPDPNIDFESLSPEQQKAEVKKFVSQTLRPLIDDIKTKLPSDERSDAQVLIDGLARVEQTGDFEGVTETPSFKAASRRVHSYDLAHCGWRKDSVTGINYAYQGVPSSLKAGTTSFDFTNKGTELHELVLFRKNAGVTESFDQLLQLPENEADKKATMVGSTSASPGEFDYFVANLEPGEYLAVCFIPVGLTPQVAQSGQQPQGAPHFTKGMKAQFTVA